MEARRERDEIRTISLHPPGITIKDERKVTDGRHDIIGWGEKSREL